MNNMSPQNGLFLDEQGHIVKLKSIIKTALGATDAGEQGTLCNDMSPQNGLFLDENGTVTTLRTIIEEAISETGGIGGGTVEKIQLSANSTHIIWKYESETQWTNLVALSTLKGAKGDQGIQGVQGTKGDKGDKGDTGSQGPAGFGTQEQYDDIIARLTALESK